MKEVYIVTDDDNDIMYVSSTSDDARAFVLAHGSTLYFDHWAVDEEDSYFEELKPHLIIMDLITMQHTFQDIKHSEEVRRHILPVVEVRNRKLHMSMWAKDQRKVIKVAQRERARLLTELFDDTEAAEKLEREGGA